MKLPEHYEAWLEEFDEPRRGGARSMYRKLMQDFKPAIEALLKISLGHEYSCGTEAGCRCTCRAGGATKALSALKEKGLKGWEE